MPEFRSIIEDFATTMDALRDFVTSVGPVLTQRRAEMTETVGKAIAPYGIAALLAQENGSLGELPEEMQKDIDDLRKKISGLEGDLPPEKIAKMQHAIQQILPIKIVNNKIEIDLDRPAVGKIQDHRQALEKVTKEVGLLYEGSLMALTSRSEWLVAQLLHVYFHMYPEAAEMSDPFFSLDALASLKTIEDARDVLIDHKVESLMRLSFEEWLKYFREKPKLGMSYLDPDVPRIAEIFKRRNLIVHNGGRVSRRYFDEVDESLRVGMKLGEVAEIAPDYLNGSIDLSEHQLILVAAELWKKLEPVDDGRGSVLLNMAVRHLTAGRWSIAEGFAYFVMNDKNLSEKIRLSGRVNYWQSYKWSDRYEEIRDEVENWDFSANSLIFQLAKAVIKDDFETCFNLLPKSLDSGELTRNQLENWPLFQVIRQRPEFDPYLRKDELAIEPDARADESANPDQLN